MILFAVLVSNVNFSKSSIGRIANLAADWLAKCGVKEMCLLNWVVNPPSPLSGILKMDCSLLNEAVGIG